MIDEETMSTTLEHPSKKKIAQATVVAILIAGVILITAVLPAEYGIDALGTGAALGLTDLSKSAAAQPPKPVPGSATPVDPSVSSPKPEPSGNGEAPIIKGVFTAQPSRYKIDSRELRLAPGEGIEIKYHLQKGAGMVYSWTANGGNVLYEFHGEPDVKPAGSPEDYFESYEKNDTVGKDQAHGTFTAPSTGIHGWFWENQSGGPVTIKLFSAGFYDFIMQNKDDIRTRLRPSDLK